jgi:hypothetical protein
VLEFETPPQAPIHLNNIEFDASIQLPEFAGDGTITKMTLLFATATPALLLGCGCFRIK